MDWQEISIVATIVLVVLGPGYWLWRDALRHGRSPYIWVTLYAIAIIPPTRFRFIFGPLVFIAWFLLRDTSFPLLRRIGKLIPGLRNKRQI